MQLTDTAKMVLEKRYLQRSPDGELAEDPEGMFRRVANAVAEAEEKDKEVWADRFYELMSFLHFLPNSPTLMNAGTGGTLSACFVLDIEDSLEGILLSGARAARIIHHGGGVGFNLSNLRGKAEIVKSTGGKACGPVAVLRYLHGLNSMIDQGGKRHAAEMAILHVDHPDIGDFITCKRDDPDSLHSFNISVALTDLFMKAATMDDVRAYHSHPIENPSKKLLWAMVEGAWATGDPGCFFIDTANRHNPTPHLGRFEATNPCGEVPLLFNESCNLGSINVAAYHRGTKDEPGEFDWYQLAKDIRLAVRFLDNVITINSWPDAMIRDATLLTRKIGLGVMGWADLLALRGIPYDSEQAITHAEELMAFIQENANRASVALAEERESYPALNGEPIRNATRTCIAPTGSIALIAGCSSSIEPHWSGVYDERMGDGTILKVEHPLCPSKGALDISPDWHLRHQAAFQKYTDQAVSKTVNLPNNATVEDVYHIFQQAWQMGCKGVTVYRDGSRTVQALESTDKVDAHVPRTSVESPEARRRLPDTRNALVRHFHIGDQGGYAIVSRYPDNKIGEVFLVINREGVATRGWADLVATFLSLGLQYGVPVTKVIEKLRYSSFDPAGRTNDPEIPFATSIPDYLGHLLEVLTAENGPPTPMGATCPQCGGANVVPQEGCIVCQGCGWSRCG